MTFDEYNYLMILMILLTFYKIFLMTSKFVGLLAQLKWRLLLVYTARFVNVMTSYSKLKSACAVIDNLNYR